jgi:hypothetical protein
MFGDACPGVMREVRVSTDAYQLWEGAVEDRLQCTQGQGGTGGTETGGHGGKGIGRKQGKVVILELGCGVRVPSVRREVEEVLMDICSLGESANLGVGVVPKGMDSAAKVNKDGYGGDGDTKGAPASAPATAVLIRINLDHAGIGDDLMAVSPNSISIQGPCKDALVAIDKHINSILSRQPTSTSRS